MKQTMFNRDGYIKLAPKVDDEPYHPIRKSEPQTEIDFCTNCKKRTCKYGTCRQLKRMKREMKEEANNA